MGVILPDRGFLRGLREITTQSGALLIFDEVISGFRVGTGGAQELYGISPDLTCLGKIIGGGLPVGAYGGKKFFMEQVAPGGEVYQAGTLSGNPLAMAAGSATLKILKDRSVYAELEEKGRVLFQGLEEVAAAAGLDVTINRVGSFGSLFFHPGPVNDFDQAKASNGEMFQAFYRSMLEQGIYLAPSPFEAWFLSAAHGHEDIQKTIECAEKSMKSIM
jgi:glutamate-1-semialdehyde 2,1-aminomutase